MHAEVKKVYVERGATSKWCLLLLVALMLLPDVVLHTAILGLPQGVFARSSITNLAVIAIGASLLTLTVLKYFGRKVLLALFFVNLAVSVFIAALHGAFRHVPGYRLAYQNVAEGIAVANVWWIFFPLPFFLFGLACGAAALVAGRGASRDIPRSWLLVCGVLFAALHLTLALRVDPAVYLVSNTPNGFAHRHGYYVSQVYDLARSALQGERIANAIILDVERHPVPTLRLAGADALGGLSSVLLVQVESLGWEVLHLKESGKAVTPFLNSWRNGSRS
jgi:phosphoglycerol transferase MdoB-like AlkP superfamily enzyme